MKITMIGTGYVGLVTGVCLAHLGHTVTCIDSNTQKIQDLQNGIMPIYENGLEHLIHQCVSQSRLFFTDDFARSVSNSQAIFICVGTPSKPDGSTELSAVFGVAEKIAQTVTHAVVIVDKSTVPVGTAHQVRHIIAKHNPNLDFDVVSNPEFLREGVAIEDFLNPDRIVVGVENKLGRHTMQHMYAPLTKQGIPLMITDTKSAEMIKYATNAFLATKITFANDLADLCEKVGGNITDVTKGFGMDTRIGNKFLHPGPGYGGSCFPKDTLALVHSSNQHNVPMDIIRTVIKTNEDRKQRMTQKILNSLPSDAQTVTVLGLTFKPNTDDVRESPALTIIPNLLHAGMSVCTYDPEGMVNARPHLPQSVTFCQDIEHACHNTDAIVIMTEWGAFSVLDFATLATIVRTKNIVDLRNVYDLDAMQNIHHTHGFTYHSVGRQSIPDTPLDL